jgi:hypothetical protein
LVSVRTEQRIALLTLFVHLSAATVIGMHGVQLAIRFTERQVETIDALVAKTGESRSTVLRRLVDEAERALLAERYVAAYPKVTADVDAFGDLDAFRDDAEAERVESRSVERTW